MSMFKVGDKVVRKEGMGKDTFFQDRLGSKIYYVVTSVSNGGYWLQLDGLCSNLNTHPWYVLNFELYQEPDDELPPAPSSVSYIKDGGQRKLRAQIAGCSVNLILSLRKVSTLGYSLDPDAALQLAHDIRRMAMEIKRKEKVQ